MKRTTSSLLGVAAAALLAGCSATPLTTAWNDPAAGPIRASDTFLVVAIARNPAVRRAAEDELVRQLGADRAKASYAVLEPGDRKDEAAAKAKIRAAGFDYAIVVRPLERREEVNWVPGQISTYPVAYRSFWGYYRVGWRAFETPGYARTDTVVAVETLLYSLTDEKVVWAAEAETRNPSGAAQVVKEVASAAAKDLRKRGLLHPR